MMLRKWDNLPPEMRTPEVKKYYDILAKRKLSLFLKRLFDITVSGFLLILLSPVFLITAIAIKLDSDGPVFYRQTRVTQYGQEFKIYKFRSMVTGADRGSQLTVSNDSRVTKVGSFIRKYKIDELSQLIDVFRGTMTFVGTRPEVPKYVEKYTDEMMATLLLPAGITSEASVFYRNESELLDAADDAEKTYLEVVLPDKMFYNLAAIEKFGLVNDIKILFTTFISVFKKSESQNSDEKTTVKK